MKKGWLTNNVANILDIIMVIGTIFLAFLVLTGFIPIDATSKEVIFYVFGALMAIVTSIYNYHRGSSQGSKDKTDLMDNRTNEAINSKVIEMVSADFNKNSSVNIDDKNDEDNRDTKIDKTLEEF